MVSESDSLPATGAEWNGSAERRKGTWWEDWAVWSANSSGPLQDPPRMGSEKYPVLGAGPGGYVLT
jgi:polyhydroxyalkanoate synthase